MIVLPKPATASAKNAKATIPARMKKRGSGIGSRPPAIVAAREEAVSPRPRAVGGRPRPGGAGPRAAALWGLVWRVHNGSGRRGDHDEPRRPRPRRPAARLRPRAEARRSLLRRLPRRA